ncbi:MAG: cell division transport system ATP-binding protein [Rhodothermales bacterium]
MIELNGVSASYPLPGGDRREVFKGLDLTIDRGEMVYLVGPTGSGKTTLLRLLYLDSLPTAGFVRVADFRSDRMKPSEVPFLRRSLGIVFQDFQLLPDRDVYENVAFALYVTGKKVREVRSRVLHVLSWVGLSHKRRRYPHELSGGEQQRVVIARAIVNEPWVILADEPTGNLDPAASDEIQRLFLNLHAQGMTILIATHDYRLLKKYPARTLAVSDGTVKEVDSSVLPS